MPAKPFCALIIELWEWDYGFSVFTFISTLHIYLKQNKSRSLIEVCMGVGILIGMGFPRKSHRGNSMKMGVVFRLLLEMGMGMTSWEWELRNVKKVLFCIACSDR